jgi:hypothetical protein
MPGTKLHEDFKSANRLDHTDWGRYDTRHVVFEPRHMTREQLMDGYCWLYEESYASPRALDRLERFWSRHRRRPSSLLEKAFIAWRLRPFQKEGTERFRRLLKDGWRRLQTHSHGDLGQLLYYFDSGHFTDYLDRYRSASYEDNVRIFRGETTADEVLERKQWEHRRTEARAI